MSGKLLPYRVELESRSGDVTPRAGLPLVLDVLRTLDMPTVFRRELGCGVRSSAYSLGEKAEALVLLLASGGEAIDDIEHLRRDEGLCRLLGRSLPAASTLRDFLYGCHDPKLIEEAKVRLGPDQTAYIPEETARLLGLARARTKMNASFQALRPCSVATIDFDATIQESHKQEAMAHYKKGRGYQPCVAYWVEQRIVVADEYRDGNVPAGMANLPVIQEAFQALPEGVTSRYFRADSAAYEEGVLRWLNAPERIQEKGGRIGFSISADMSVPLREACEKVPPSRWQFVEDRPTETVWCADVEFVTSSGSKDEPARRYVAVRFVKKQGDLFPNGTGTKYLAVVSNRWGLSAVELLRWHWEKAGTIELVHDVMKNELGAAVPPCGRFGANAAWYRLSSIAFNAISMLKSLALPETFLSARPKRIRFAVFTVAGKVIAHAGSLILRIAEKVEELAGIRAARARLAALSP